MLNKVRNTNSSGSGNGGCIKMTSQYNLGVNSFVDYGPTTNTGFWQAIDPGTGGYCIYQFKGANYGDQGPSIYRATNDSQLTSFTQHITGSALTPNQCISYYNQQSDKFVTNINYPDIVTNNAVFLLDAGFVKSAWQTGTTVFTDLSFNGNNFTLSNVDFVQSGNSREASYFNFVSANTSTAISNGITALPTMSSFTMNVFFKQNGLQSGYVFLMSNSSAGAIIITGSTVYGSIRTLPSTDYVELYDNSYTTNEWYNTTITYNSVTKLFSLYKNGALVSSTTITGTPFLNGGNTMYIGNAGSAGLFNGWIPVVQLYDRALNSSEVLQNYNAYYTRYSLPANNFQFSYQVRTLYSLSGSETIDNGGAFSVNFNNPVYVNINASSAVTINDTIQIQATAPNTGILRGIQMRGIEIIGGTQTEVSTGYAFNGNGGTNNPPFTLSQSGASYIALVNNYPDLNYYVNLTTAGSGDAAISFSGQGSSPIYSSPTTASGDYNNIVGPILNFGDTVTVGVNAGSAPTLLTIEKQNIGMGAITSIYSANTSSAQSINFTYETNFSYSISITS
jgi:hypothetical protein